MLRSGSEDLCTASLCKIIRFGEGFISEGGLDEGFMFSCRISVTL